MFAFDYSKTPFIVYFDLEEKSWIPMRNGRLATYGEARELYDDLAYYLHNIKREGDE